MTDHDLGVSGRDRQNVGGCGVWNRDAGLGERRAVAGMNQALTDGVVESGMTNDVVLDMSQSLNGHRVCENTVGLLEEVSGAADVTEWVAAIRTVSAVFGPYEVQESSHSSHWGQLAMRNCLRQAHNDAALRSGTCTSTGGVNALGEPNMQLDRCWGRSVSAGARGPGGGPRGAGACCDGQRRRTR